MTANPGVTSDSRTARAWRQIRIILLSLFVGVLVSLATVLLIELIDAVQHLSYGASSEQRYGSIAAAAPAWRTVAALVVGGLIVGLLIHVMPKRRYHGIADVMEACAFNAGRMGVRSGIGAFFAAGISLGVGAPLGREGPAVHIGASISAWLAERLHLDRNQSLTLLGCGAAAAVSTSFNAPIAGVLFALEVIVGYYTLRVFVPVVIASSVGAVVRHQIYGAQPVFELEPLLLAADSELIACALLGLASGLVVQGFIAMTALYRGLWKRSAVWPWLQPALAGLIIGLVCIRYPMLLSVGYESVNNALRELFSLADLLILCVLKFLLSSLAVASGFAGGVFGPAMVVGAMLGGSAGFLLEMVPVVDTVSGPAFYTVIGLASVSSAMFGAPVSTVLLAFEITRSYDATVAVMVAVAFSSALMQFFKHRSFFRWQLASRGVNINTGRDVSLLRTRTIEPLIKQSYAWLAEDLRVREAEKQLGVARRRIAAVLDAQHQFVGITDLRELVVREAGSDEAVTVGDCMFDESLAVTGTANLQVVLQHMAHHDVDYLPVVEADKEGQLQLQGIVFKSDVLAAHYDAMRQAREDEFGVT